MVMSNLWNAASKGGDGHYVKEAAILTCATIKKTPGADLANGISMDQVAAQRVGDQTPLPSLELGVTPVAIGVDAVVGYTRVYGSHIAWSSPTTPLAQGDQSALGVRAAVPRLVRSARQRGQDGHAAARPRAGRRQAAARAGGRRATACGWTSIWRVMRSLEERVQRAGSVEADGLESRACPSIPKRCRTIGRTITPSTCG